MIKKKINTLIDCENSILKMLKKSQTKVIFPIITLALIKKFNTDSQYIFKDSEIKKNYEQAVKDLQKFLHHNFHIGGKYYDAYPVRNLPKYGILNIVAGGFEITKPFRTNAKKLQKWIPEQIRIHIDSKLGIIPKLNNLEYRVALAKDLNSFKEFINNNITVNSTNFEVFSFAVIKVHLEKFACKVYRDTRTSAYDKGVDLSTNFGAVYQIKKLKLTTIKHADEIYSEIKSNFDEERMHDGKVIIVIDDISKEVKKYLINIKVQSICKNDILKLAIQFDELEDRMKILKIIHEEFRREYESNIN